MGQPTSGMDAWITDTEISPRFPYYTRANADEVGPEPFSPLGWSLGWMQGCIPGVASGFVAFGVLERDEFAVDPPEVFGNWGGYFYNQLSLPRLMGVRMPGASTEAIDLAYFGDHPGVPAYVPHPNDENAAQSAKLAETMGWAMSTDGFPLQEASSRTAMQHVADRPDLASLSNHDLVARARARRTGTRRGVDGLLPVGARRFARARCGTGDLHCHRPRGRRREGDDRARRDRVGRCPSHDVGHVPNGQALTEPHRRVRCRRRRAARSSRRLERAGRGDLSRAVAGPDRRARAPRPERVGPPLALVDHQADDAARDDRADAVPGRQQVAQRGPRRGVAERERLTAELLELVEGDAEAHAGLQAGIHSAGVFYGLREMGKNSCIRLIHEAKLAMLEVGARMVADGVIDDAQQIFMLLDSEVDDFLVDPSSMAGTIRERDAVFHHLATLEPPYIVGLEQGVPPISQWPARGISTGSMAAVGDVLQGATGSPGVVSGIARVVLDPSDPGAIGPGDIMVAPTTDPSWVPLFLAAEGVVVDVGAVASHAAIMCRELGIPCAVSVHEATKRIPDGCTIEIDGSTGAVTIISAA